MKKLPKILSTLLLLSCCITCGVACDNTANSREGEITHEQTIEPRTEAPDVYVTDEPTVLPENPDCPDCPDTMENPEAPENPERPHKRHRRKRCENGDCESGEQTENNEVGDEEHVAPRGKIRLPEDKIPQKRFPMPPRKIKPNL